MTAERHPGVPPCGRASLTNRHILDHLEGSLGLRPFAYMGSNLDRRDPRWLSYLVATSRSREGGLAECCVKASGFERTFVWLLRLASGRFPMYRAQNSRQLAIQLVLNGITGGNGRGNFRFLRAALGSRAPLFAKRILFQNPAEADPAGRIIHCAQCPDAVLLGGHLVPVCLADKVTVGS
jgi:hypothetical protein